MDLAPPETACRLVKPRPPVRGTWHEAKEAAARLGERPAEHAHRSAVERDRDTGHQSRLVDSAAVRLTTGADVSYGFHLERPAYLSPAVATCSPNRSTPTLSGPLG
ncbi:hypothetical protein [Streptomyces sp. NPDC057623]|uniref:hypothetical protein n=1 Tax=Streptomyces sp. NPDC057623 TaxID=3346187 RepID=UPI0036B85F7F